MPTPVPFIRVTARTRGLPALWRYAATVALTVGVFLLRRTLDPILPPEHFPFPLFFAAVLLAVSLFGRGCGFLAITLSVPLIAYFYVPPVQSFAMGEQEAVSMALFVGVALAMTLVIEALHGEASGLRRLAADRARAERARALLLQEFRHRTRNDLHALVGLLHMRARAAPSPVARDALQEAAEHTMAFARVHARLALDGTDDAVAVDSREFVAGLCADLATAQAGEGLRPVALVAEAEAHPLSTERAVALGLVLNEAATNALKYAFPDDRAGTVRVRFAQEGDAFVLVVADDGLGLPAEGDAEGASSGGASPRGTGLGTRLMRAFAAQLRGSLVRRPGEGGCGTVVELRFPAEARSSPSR